MWFRELYNPLSRWCFVRKPLLIAHINLSFLMAAYPKSSAATARTSAPKLLANPSIKKYLAGLSRILNQLLYLPED